MRASVFKALAADAIQRQQLLEQIEATLGPVNIAGLNQPEKRNWYPVQTRDLFAGREKLRASKEDIDRLLKRCGMDISS